MAIILKMININNISGYVEHGLTNQNNHESEDKAWNNRVNIKVNPWIINQCHNNNVTYVFQLSMGWSMSSICIHYRFVTRNRHFRDGKLYITCIAKISDVYHAEVKDAAVGILGNVTQQTNQIVIGASPSKILITK